MAKRRQQTLIAAMPRRVGTTERNDDWDSIDASNGEGIGASSGSDGSSGFAPGNGVPQNWQLVQGMANSQVFGAIQKNGIDSSRADKDSANPVMQGMPSPSQQNAFAGNRGNLQGQYDVGGSAGGANQTSSQQQDAAPRSNWNGQDNQGQMQADNGSTLADNSLRSQGPNETTANGDPISTATNSGQSATGAASGGSAQAGSSASNGSTASNGSGSRSGSSGSNSQAPQGYNDFSSGSGSGGGASSLSASTSPSQASGDPAANPNVSLSMNQNAEVQPPKAKHVRAEGDLKPISVSAGHGWAASRAEGKATPVSRPVNVVALKDRWLLRSDVDPNAFEANITMEEGPQQAGNQLAMAIRKRVDSWGLSVPGGFWSPTLTIEAASDAQQSVARLERLLEGSGVEIKVVPLTLPNRR